jgi:hypothetical protein
MILIKSALSSLLVLLSGCDHREPSSPDAARAMATSATAPTPPSTATPEQDAIATSPAASIEARIPTLQPTKNKPAKPIAQMAYVCPMHPEVVSDAPRLCPKCNMKLEPKPAAEAPRSHAGHDHAEDGQ